MDGTRRLRLLAVGVFLPAFLYGQRTTFSFISGVNLTRDFPITRQSYVDPRYPQGVTAFDLFSDKRNMMAGLSFEVAFGGGFSLEANALRRPLTLQRRFLFPEGLIQDDGSQAVGTWQWPILVKYRLPYHSRAKPFVEAGPSFRTRHDPAPTEPSQFGFTIGAGAEYRWGRFRVAPVLRYTRWQYDGDFPRIPTKRDQVELLTAVSYATSVPSWKVGGKKLRLGLIGGTPFTTGLRQAENQLQGYVAGFTAELELRPRFSLEANTLYRPLRVGGDATSEFTVLTWQFPVLAKWRFHHAAAVQPVLEAGPSFRSSGNLNGYNPSWLGVTSGAGFETTYKALKVGPVLRYTRWSADQERWGFLRYNRTAPNQVELLVSFTF